MSVDARGGNGAHILVVDDEAMLLRAYSRVLIHAGFTVDTASDGHEAIDRLQKTRYDVVLSDIAMPGMDGLALLRKIREYDPDVPVILITAVPTVSTAVRAIEYGALRYLIKPVDAETLENVVRSSVKLNALGRVRRQISDHIGAPELSLGDLPSLELSFDRALKGLWLAYQPIVSPKDGTVYGYEALLRSTEPALHSPAALLGAAERLDRMLELGRAIRAHAANTLGDNGDVVAFVNLHTLDLADETLYDRSLPFSSLASRIVLEITERAALDDIPDVPARIARLREMGFRIAIDDLGAGYAGLSSFAQLVPEVVKLDISLVHGIDEDPIRRKLVQSMTNLCHEMNILVIAEGVETREELDVVVELGCDLIQGYLIARPSQPFPKIRQF
jgi:EAL domain-containing protein (putative c-di-GMP-specific phosphodiesterase class I)